MRMFSETLPVSAETRVLDVGGDAALWHLLPIQPRVTILNMPRAAPDRAGFQLVFGTGCALPFPDQSFDVVFSNSVIEHVGDAAAQHLFAEEIRRVGRSYFVQTPNRWFPIEPHLLTPIVHWLPPAMQAFIVRRATVWQWLERPTEDRRRFYVEHYLNDIRLLGREEMARLFPGARIVKERWMGWTKSLVAVKQAST
jgi:Methyltransferase domain